VCVLFDRNCDLTYNHFLMQTPLSSCQKDKSSRISQTMWSTKLNQKQLYQKKPKKKHRTKIAEWLCWKSNLKCSGKTLHWAERNSCRPIQNIVSSSVKRTKNSKVLITGGQLGTLKGLVHPKMKILSVFTHPHVVPTP